MAINENNSGLEIQMATPQLFLFAGLTASLKRERQNNSRNSIRKEEKRKVFTYVKEVEIAVFTVF